jgi:hypothetical protein
VYVSWVLDERPTWRVRLTYGLSERALRADGSAARLEDAVTATGLGRNPVIRIDADHAVVAMLVKGVDDVEAAVRALAIVDSAERDACLGVLGDLIARAAVAVPHGVRGVR